MTRFCLSCLALFSALSINLMSSSAFAYRLPDTGQSQCYNQTAPLTSCPAPGSPLGQDGSYSQHPMSFTDNLDGTITDNNTGLMWQKCSAGQSSVTCSGSASTYSWSGSLGYCDALPLGGHSDWRLPTRKELITIVDYSVPLGRYAAPSINTSLFPNTQVNYYWTQTELAVPPLPSSYAWYVSFDLGFDGSNNKVNGYPVRCVRGATLPGPSFVDHGDGTVTDLSTGLMWMQGETSVMAWDTALALCETSSFPSSPVTYADWRLPDVKELGSLSDESIYNPAVPPSVFPLAKSSYYWSSTTSSLTAYPNKAWAVSFDRGYLGYDPLKTTPYYARCVRGGQYGSLAKLDITNPVAGGAVISHPAGIDCGTACSGLYPLNSVVGLTVIPDVGSVATGWPFFVQWTGDPDCSDGMVTLNVSKTHTCTANISLCESDPPPTQPALTNSDQSLHDTINLAYNHAQPTDTIYLLAVHMQETLDFNLLKNVTLIGGGDCGATPSAYPYTFVTGTFIVRNGSVRIENIVIM